MDLFSNMLDITQVISNIIGLNVNCTFCILITICNKYTDNYYKSLILFTLIRLRVNDGDCPLHLRPG